MGKKIEFLKRLLLALWRNKEVVKGPDSDFKANMKIGVKTKVEF